MNKTLILFVAICSSLSASHQPIPPKIEKKQCSCTTAETALSYLYWRAREDNLIYAVENALIFTPIDPNSQPDAKFKAPGGTWHSGCRLETAVTNQNPRFKHFGVRGSWTYFEMGSSSSVRTLDFATFPLTSTTISSLLAGGGNPFLICAGAKGKWHLQLNEFALNLDYFLHVAEAVVFKPYVGLFGASIHQKLDSFFEGTPITVPVTRTIDLKDRMLNKYWGVGPSVGFRLQWAFWDFFRLIGNACLAGLYGPFDSRSTITAPKGIGIDFLFPNFTENGHCLRTMVGTLLGFEAGGAINTHASIAFSASYEWQYWPHQWRLISSGLPNFFAGTGGWGDLSVQGYVFSAKVSF